LYKFHLMYFAQYLTRILPVYLQQNVLLCKDEHFLLLFLLLFAASHLIFSVIWIIIFLQYLITHHAFIFVYKACSAFSFLCYNL